MAEFLNQQLFFGLLGGLGLFLYGMKIMSEGLHKIAGDRMRKILSALTNNRIIGTLVGISVTAIIQSSSATTVMTVGFVNAGLMSLTQAIGVVLGANIGTTVTAQLIAFKVSQFALPAIGIGAGFKLFSKQQKFVYLGEIVLGFGILFFGLATLKQAFDPLKASDDFRQLFLLVGDYKVLGVLVGALLTIIVQSSSATIGITLALASSGLLSFEASVALILGENIGTTITANVAAIGTNLAARRTAFAHFLFNSLGTLYMLILFPWFLKIIASITPGDADLVIQTQAQAVSFSASIGDKPYIARHIANAHTLFNIINTLIFLPLVGVLAKLSTIIVRGQDRVESMQVKFIDNRVLNTPPIAIGQARRETQRMAQIVFEMLEETTYFLETGDTKKIRGLEKQEELVDMLQKEITAFLVKLSQQSISSETSIAIGSFLSMVNDLERIGDHCENLWRLGLRKIESKIIFSETGENEISAIGDKAKDFLHYVLSSLDSPDSAVAIKSMEYEDAIDEMEKRMKNSHIARLNTGECAVSPGLIFIDILHNFEKIGDHTFNLSEAVVADE